MVSISYLKTLGNPIPHANYWKHMCLILWYEQIESNENKRLQIIVKLYVM